MGRGFYLLNVGKVILPKKKDFRTKAIELLQNTEKYFKFTYKVNLSKCITVHITVCIIIHKKRTKECGDIWVSTTFIINDWYYNGTMHNSNNGNNIFTFRKRAWQSTFFEGKEMTLFYSGKNRFMNLFYSLHVPPRRIRTQGFLNFFIHKTQRRHAIILMIIVVSWNTWALASDLASLVLVLEALFDITGRSTLYISDTKLDTSADLFEETMASKIEVIITLNLMLWKHLVA